MIIDIWRDDIKSYIYFISSMSQEKMYGGLSSKSDLMGGIFDRWINIISEGAIFNKYFLKKISPKYKVISDFYRYNPINIGIAPDLLGIRTSHKDIPFAKFGQNGWMPYKNAPQIEVKTFKKDQYLVSLRNQHYDGKYLVLLQMFLNPAYLVPFFSKDIFSCKVYSSLKMNNKVFIEEGFSKEMKQTPKIIKDKKIGTLELIRVTTANEFMNCCDLCGPKISPQYIKTIDITRKLNNPREVIKMSTLCDLKGKLFTFNERWYKLQKNKSIKTLSWKITNIDQIEVIKITGSSISINALADGISINNIELSAGNSYLIKFGLLDRSGANGAEYFMHKSIIEVVDEYEEEMILKIKEHIENEKG